MTSASMAMMRAVVTPLALALFALAPSVALAHGLEREFGAPIDAGSGVGPPPRARSSPAFALLVLEVNVRAIARGLEPKLTPAVQQHASRFPKLTGELVAASRELSDHTQAEIASAVASISDAGEQIEVAASAGDASAVRIEIDRINAVLGRLQDLLGRDSKAASGLH